MPIVPEYYYNYKLLITDEIRFCYWRCTERKLDLLLLFV